MRTRLVALLAALIAAAAVAGCGGGADTGKPLTITSYRGADWITDGTIEPPASPGRGDRIQYPHTMDGAVMAAANSQTLLDTAPDDGFGPVTRDYFAVGNGLTAYLAARASISITGQPDPSRLPRIKGFRFLKYTDNAARLELFFEQPDKSINGLVRNLVWLGENWLIQLPDPGDKNAGPVLKAYPDGLPADIEPLPQT
ncbi:hypothetical protein IU414_27405 [Nocardia farcinica]|jgi:hypothetical protein|uniref:hypothetical protein n=1 Tax=Nocardia TaxID=1817 RepID=UPI0002E4E0F2|nr:MULTISPECIES: hypothetical protein [Nocardia]MBF6588475.1 hypothetical protein [Nocardia farcinica]